MPLKDRKAASEYMKRWRRGNASERAKVSARAAVHRSWIKSKRKEVKDVPCADCGLKYPHYVMDLDHRPGVKKLFNLAAASSRRRSRKQVLAEFEKCDVVCANCHRERTYQRRVTQQGEC